MLHIDEIAISKSLKTHINFWEWSRNLVSKSTIYLQIKLIIITDNPKLKTSSLTLGHKRNM